MICNARTVLSSNLQLLDLIVKEEKEDLFNQKQVQNKLWYEIQPPPEIVVMKLTCPNRVLHLFIHQ
jgi:hypothetical protein